MRTKIILLVISLFLFTYQRAYTMQIAGGRVIDVVVADSGYTDSTFVTEFFENWLPVGPESFDIDKDGNIYVLDHLSERILKFDKEGNWITTLKGISESGQSELQPLQDMAVDNYGNVYVAKVSRVMKFSPQGKFLLESEDLSKLIGFYIIVDKRGRVYDPYNMVVYDQELKLREVIRVDTREYTDIGIVQKEVGNDIFFRQNKYLFRTSLEEYGQNGKIDTIAVLPKEITNPRFLGERTWKKYHPSPETFCLFMGFDKNSCFYFYKQESWGNEEKHKWRLKGYTIFRYRLRKGKLEKVGEVTMTFEEDEAEYSNTSFILGAIPFYSVVAGDGTIYWVHGTVDMVKVSKIIFDE